MKQLKRLLFTAIAVLACCGICMACYSSKDIKADNTKVKKNVPVGYFSSVELTGMPDIRFVQGKKASVSISGPKSLVESIDVTVSGDKLVVTQKSGRNNFWYSGDNTVTLYVSSPDLTGVSVKGSGCFYMDSNLDTDALGVSVVGSGEAIFRNVVCDKANFELRGSGDIKVESVECRSAECDLMGSGDMDIKRLKADNAGFTLKGSGDMDAALYNVASTTASVLGSGDIDLSFSNCGDARCEVRGSGDIELKGTLGSLSQTCTGTGDIDTEKLNVGHRLQRTATKNHM